jgi:uncharacterized protein
MATSHSPTALGIFVRYPQPGRVKTRLAAEWGAEQAAELYAAFIEDTLDRFCTTANRRWICHTPANAAAAGYFAALACGDYELWPQPEGSLGERMAAFFESCFASGFQRVVIIGSDSPTLPRDYVEQAFEQLAPSDAPDRGVAQQPSCAVGHACVLGPATDGGYYLVGLRERLLPIFDGIEWSTPQVLRQTVARLRTCGATLVLLPPWYDVDAPDDVELLRGHIEALQACGGPVPERTAAVLRSGGRR